MLGVSPEQWTRRWCQLGNEAYGSSRRRGLEGRTAILAIAFYFLYLLNL